MHRFTRVVYEVGCLSENFCYDNGEPARKRYAGDFEVDKRQVTNADYQVFVQDGRNGDFQYWLFGDWENLRE